MADIVDSNTAPRTPVTADTTPSPANPTTPPQTHTWNDANAQNQTPVVRKVAGTDRFSVDDERRIMKQQYIRVAEETQGHYLVGMDPEEFMQTFLPWNADTPAAYRTKSIPEERLRDLHRMASKKPEKAMYGAFTAALQGWPIEKKEEANGANVIVTKFGEYRKPDGECRNLAVDMGHYTEDNLPAKNATVHRLMETNVEFKPSASDDPFVDPPETTTAGAPIGNSDTVSEVEEDNVNYDSFADAAAGAPPLSQPSSGYSSPSISTGAAVSSSAESAVLDVPITANDWPGESKLVHGKETRGQIASYAGITMFLSYRKHFMSVVVFGRFARLIFWDRRGAVVSRRIKYQETDGEKTLFKFYLRFSQLTAEQRGYDPTVVEVPPTDPDAEAALVQFKKYDRDMWHCNAQMRSCTEAMGVTLPEDRFLRMTVKFGNSAERSFIVPAPVFEDTCISPFSRSTRRSLAYDCAFTSNPGKDCQQSKKSKHDSLLFMKDYWREESLRTRPEAEIYDILAEKKVPHVATMVVGGDVEGMRTKTHEPRLQLSSAYPPTIRKYFRLENPLQCHRLFLDTIARDLSAFGNCKVLVNCIADAMEAAQCAFDLARILHRDISSGNIMITPTHEGLLIDWDLCIVLDFEGHTHRPGRTGTWQFMSINLLQGGKDKQSVVHTLDDDRESAFWVLVYVALRYLKHDMPSNDLYDRLLLLFDHHTVDAFGRQTGGHQKTLVLPYCADDSCGLAQFDVPGFNDLLTDLAGILLVRYRQPSAKDFEAYEVKRAKLAQWGIVDDRDSVAIYQAKLERRANPRWLYETLRHHASLIPLPAQRSPPVTEDASSRKAKRRLEEVTSHPITYDFHENELLSSKVENGTKRLKTISLKHMNERLEGMGARSFNSRPAEDKEPESKRLKLDESDES
ncbi:hypothetical protein CPB85DRAFT_1445295 [Mucidula mucida]|nr:hypothetical protein CPB85DRAFT_1445295 [Mucidula mucida]